MQPFVYQANATKVVFGCGKFETLATEVGALGSRLLVLSTPRQLELAERAQTLLGPLSVGLHPHAAMHVPVEVARAAVAQAVALNADGLVAMGGGSTIGLAKAIALETGLPIIAVPTTYSGSEMTAVWGLTEGGIKRTGKDAKVSPRTVIYDPLLTVGLPASVSGVSGLNAIAHSVEGLYSDTANPLISIMAEESIRALGHSLPRVVRNPSDVDARSDALYGAWLSGIVLGSVGMALHHKFCHTLGGTFNLPHAETHAIILPHAAAYNAAAAPEAMARIARALGAETAPQALYDLVQAVGAATGLRDIGMPRDGLERVVELTLTNPYYNPAPLDAGRLRTLLERAYEGLPPAETSARAGLAG